MAPRTQKSWWQRVRGRNRTLKGLINARRRYTARTERLAGKKPKKRLFSVPAIAQRIGTPLSQLKRIVRREEEASQPILTRLARDLGLPPSELRAVLEQQGPLGSGDVLLPGDPFKALEMGLVQTASAFVALLRGYRGRGARSK